MKVSRLNLQEQNQKYSFDISLLFVTLFLCVFGLIMVYSASYYTAEMKGLGGSYYFKRQLISDLVGIAGLEHGHTISIEPAGLDRSKRKKCEG